MKTRINKNLKEIIKRLNKEYEKEFKSIEYLPF